MIPPDDIIEAFVQDRFDENYELLRLDTGQALAPDVKFTALMQVLLYWRKMKSVATTVTETEVRLTLPAEKTPKGRNFTIEGIVDIVRERDYTVMYDIKTHDADDVRSNREFYERQLNVYAHIWQELRGQPLDRTAVIATAYPDFMKTAIADGRPGYVEYAMEKWNPLVDIPFDQKNVDETIADFAQTVDDIEDGIFPPAPFEKLKEKPEGSRTRFATRVCLNCDARFSCDSYRAYALTDKRTDAIFRDFFADAGSDEDKDARLNAGLGEQLMMFEEEGL